jgi:hypothetical protein
MDAAAEWTAKSRLLRTTDNRSLVELDTPQGLQG